MDWTLEEVLLIIHDYFDMLTKELVGQKYVKTHHRKKLLPFLNGRTELSIEKKHQNISAVMIENGLPYISGYKPLHNYQTLLKQEVEEYLSNHPELFNVFEDYISSEIAEPYMSDILKAELTDPKIGTMVKEPEVKFSVTTAKQNYYLKELRNSRLGLLGEEFVLKFEKEKLISLGRKELVKKVEHVSQTSGDSAGFDIRSFDIHGQEKFIEVKTTQMGKNAPFYFTKNELNFSQNNKERYSLYRLFDFRKKPRFFQLKGSLDNSCDIIPTQFMGWAK